MPPHPAARDLDAILDQTPGLWDGLRGARLLLTGGTGFIGCWMLESLLWADAALALGTEVIVLTRDPAAFRRKAPRLACHSAVRLLAGDVRTFELPSGKFTHVIHAAADTDAGAAENDPLAVFETLVLGTRRVLETARAVDARSILLVSSGAVYGRQPPDIARVPEDAATGPDPADWRAAYAEGKRAAEQIGVLHARQGAVEVKIARGFAFLGPYLPLNGRFAAGNFVRDALAGGPIVVQGDGTPLRSYLYAADLAAWLWTILLRGPSGRPYNVGSDRPVAIADLARLVSACAPGQPRVEIRGQPAPGRPPDRYVPDTARAARELNLRPTVALEDAVRRTLDWHRAAGPCIMPW